MCSFVVNRCVILISTILINYDNYLVNALTNNLIITTTTDSFMKSKNNSNLRDTVDLLSQARSVLNQQNDNDEYVAYQQQECSGTHNWSSCVKYRAAKLIWQLATNSFHLFPREHSRQLRDDKQTFRLIQLDEPSDMILFPEARSNEGDNVSTSMVKFLKRALELFGQSHGLQVTLPSGSGVRVTEITDSESRGPKEKKKIKWTIILQLITLMKIAHLKMTVVNMLLLTIGLNALIVLGIAWIVNYLKTKTLCKIHPDFVHTHSHSHAYDADPHEFSQFLGNDPYLHGHGGGGVGGYGGYGGYGGGAGHTYITHDTSGYGKDWSSQRKAYRGHNFLDTISKRLK